MINTGRPRSL